MTYNKDLQEDKEPLFDTVDTVTDCLEVMTTVLQTLRFDRDRMSAAARSDFTNATELADYLARRGLAFRQAHELVGKLVLHAIRTSRELHQIPLEEYREHSQLFESDLYDALRLQANLKAKSLPGGTSPARVDEAISAARSRLDSLPDGT